jgi:hypothetical protein
MRFLFTTLQFAESDFYARVSEELRRLGHEVAHLAVSRRAASALARRGFRSYCLSELTVAPGPDLDLAAETRRIEARYATPSLRDVYRCDPACRGRAEEWCVERTVRHFLALEKVIDEVAPDVIVPEVGRETMREAAYLVGIERGATVLFMLNSIFPRPLRLYANTYQGPMVAPEEVRELTPDERAEVEAFVDGFTRRGEPILAHRKAAVTPSKLRDFARHVLVRTVHERDNEYLRPSRFIRNYATQSVRRALARTLYREPRPGRRFVYFPLHVTDDFKIERVIPHCADQEYLIQLVADAVPQGCDVVLKEHPVSLGRNPFRMLRRLTKIDNVRLVDPYTSSHELIERSDAVTVISSTVGIEALMYAKPVLTMGQPYYAGFGVTLDIDSFREVREAVPALFDFKPDRERILRFLHAGMRSTYAGAPAWIDLSDENAVRLAGSLDAAARKHVPHAEPALT